MKMIIKSLVAAGVLAISSGAFAANECDGTGTAASITGASNSFILNDFSLKCSANVFLKYDATTDATKVGVCAISKKGNKRFGGSSEGGAVKESGDTVTTTPTATNAAADSAGCTNS